VTDLPLRHELRGRSPYGAPQVPAKYRLNTNENPFPLPDALLADLATALRDAAVELNRYPDRDALALRADLAAYLTRTSGVPLDARALWAANGSNEVLQHVLQAFGGPGRTAFGFAPTYSMYPLLTRATGASWVAGTRAADFTVDADSAASQVAEAQPDVVFLCAPNNPTGTPMTLEVIEAVYDATAAIVVVDEAYHEFAPRDEGSALALLPGRERLVVSRTMSKAFAFAGARVGYLAADPAVVDALRLVRLPYHLSSLTQAAATAALRHAPTMLRMVDEIVGQRDRISATLEALGYEPYESWTNFVLFDGVEDTAATWQGLYDRGVLIRDVGIAHHLRVTAGTEQETTAFLDALASLDSGA
jgi:histidinol-phosphate aminotransferase